MEATTRIQVGHTAELGAPALAAARSLLERAFAGDFGPADWEHALGGMHLLTWEGPELIGHAAVVQRRLLHGDRALRCGYVEAVAVVAERRGRGHAGTMMARVERIIADAYEIGALSASTDGVGLYRKRGWLQWPGRTAALTPRGIERTEEDDGRIFVLPLASPMDLAGELICDWRDGDVW